MYINEDSIFKTGLIINNNWIIYFPIYKIDCLKDNCTFNSYPSHILYLSVHSSFETLAVWPAKRPGLRYGHVLSRHVWYIVVLFYLYKIIENKQFRVCGQHMQL